MTEVTIRQPDSAGKEIGGDKELLFENQEERGSKSNDQSYLHRKATRIHKKSYSRRANSITENVLGLTE